MVLKIVEKYKKNLVLWTCLTNEKIVGTNFFTNNQLILTIGKVQKS